MLRVEHEGIKLVEDITMFKHHPSAAALLQDSTDPSKKESPQTLLLQNKVRLLAKGEARSQL